jgi:anthranilate synthase component 1
MPQRCSQRLDAIPDLLRLSEHFPGRFPYLLESTAHGLLGARSILPFASGEKLVAPAGATDRFFDRLERRYQDERSDDEADPGPDRHFAFSGGWFLYLGYEMASEIEPCLALPAHYCGLPDAVAHRCHGAVVVEHAPGDDADEQAWAVAESREILAIILDCVEQAGRVPQQQSWFEGPDLLELDVEEPSRFRDAVTRILEYLAAGDVFQVNISRGWSGRFRFAPNPLSLYAALCQANPAPFAGLMRWEDKVLMSSSPERLVQCRGRQVQTRPIAGTRPRGEGQDNDQFLSQELIGHPKERAEHVMLIDLERNDLGRVCRPGTVEVNELMVIESYAHVHHIVSNVRGQLRDHVSPVDAVRAVFPGGTITGCPKVRCMEIIAELEETGRGFYTGSMGYLGTDGSLDLNILIRSMLLQGAKFSLRTGAGIVADSEPEREVAETEDKARGLLLALEYLGREKKHA